MDAAFLIAAGETRPHYCLLRKLQPLTVGHLYTLAKYNSVYATGGEITINELMLAVMVCSTPVRQLNRVFKIRFLSIYVFIWGTLCRLAKLDIEKEAERFGEYINEQRKCPERIVRNPSESKTPLCWHLLAILTSDFHMSEDKAMETTVTKAFCLIHANHERKGEVESFGDTRDALWDAVMNRRGECSN